MAITDQPYPWPWHTSVVSGYISACNHGTLAGSPCFYCQHPALGPALPQTFQLGGWSCPGCLRCFSPALTECPYCPQQKPADEGAFGPLSPIPPVPVSDPAGPRPEPRPFRYHAGAACPKPAEGGMCGCGEDGDEPAGPCTSAHCSC